MRCLGSVKRRSATAETDERAAKWRKWPISLKGQKWPAGLPTGQTNERTAKWRMRGPFLQNTEMTGKMVYPQFHISPMGVQVQHGPKLPPL
jgi:hypothetical protein